MLKKNLLLNNVELKMTDNGRFSGYASTFGNVDSYNDTIAKGAYDEVIEKIGAGLSLMPKMFINHKSWEIPVGKWVKMNQDDKGLFVEGEFTKGNTDADKIRAAMQHGTVDGLSIGFSIGDYEIVESEKLRIIKSITELPEVSIVTYPADNSARVDLTSVKSALDSIGSIKELEDFLRDAGGFSRALTTRFISRSKEIFALGEPDAKEVLLDDEIKSLIASTFLKAQLGDRNHE